MCENFLHMSEKKRSGGIKFADSASGGGIVGRIPVASSMDCCSCCPVRRLVLLSATVALAALLSLVALDRTRGNLAFFEMSSAGNATAAVVGRILCYGDSLTAGYHNMGRSFAPYCERLQIKLGPKYKAEWIGLSGWTTSQLLDSVDDETTRDFTGHSFPGLRRKLQEDRFDVVVVMAGTNDLGHGRSAEEIVDNLGKIFEVVRGENKVARVLSVGVPDSAFVSRNRMASAKRDEVNAKLRALTAERKDRVSYMDCPVSYSGGDPFETDGLHFARETYEALGERLADKVRGLLPQPK